MGRVPPHEWTSSHLVCVLFSFLIVANAQVYQAAVSSCLGGGAAVAPSNQLLDFNTVSAQFVVGQKSVGGYADGVNLGSIQPALRDSNGTAIGGQGTLLRVALTGTTGSQGLGSSPLTAFLSTLDLNAQVLTFPVYSNQSALCAGIVTANGASGCPYGPGSIGLGFDITLRSPYPFATINTQLIVLDPSSPPLQLACVNLAFTPYYPSYFGYAIIHYVVIGLLAFYLVLYLIARVYSSKVATVHEQETRLATSLTVKLSSMTLTARTKFWGTVWYSAWAGRVVVVSSSLRRFVTAEMNQLWYAAVWWTLVGTVAVQFPDFAYPVFAQTAWLALIYKNSLPFTILSPSLLSSNFSPPSGFATQMGNPTSPLFLDSTVPNVLLNFQGARNGIEKWARAAGVQPEDLWSICAFTFFVMVAVVILVQLVFYVVDRTVAILNSKHANLGAGKSKRAATGETFSKGTVIGGHLKSPTLIDSGMDDEMRYERMLEQDGSEEPEEDDLPLARAEDDYPAWQLHWAMLQGNLVRLLLLFHLPLSLFSVYQFSISSTSPVSTLVLAALTFASTCIIIPTYLIWRIQQTPFIERFTSLPILLSVGPLFNTYSDECTLFAGVRFLSNIILASVIGAAQSSGIAQAAIILFVEVADTLVTSLWLPWADHAAMGPLAFVFSVTRIIVAVLLVVLTNSVGVSPAAAAWLAYIIFLMQGLVILLLLVGVAFKVLELGVRLIGDVPFDESRSPRAGGLGGAWRRWDRGGRGKPSSGGKRKRKPVVANRRYPHSGSVSTTGTQTRMLAAAGREQGHSRTSSSNSSPFDQRNYHNQSTDQFYPGPGYVNPGSYSSSPQPILRSGPIATAPAISTFLPSDGPPPTNNSTSGFSRVGGGRASSSSPYQALGGASGSTTAYPPYPNNSSAEQFAMRPSNPPGNPRRLSQSAVIEMASASALDEAPALTPSRSRPNLPPSDSSNFLSNTVVRRSDQYTRPTARTAKPKPRLGFFGRRKKQTEGDDETTDESDDEDEEAEEERRVRGKGSKGIWPIRLGRKRTSAEVVVPEEEVPPSEKGFAVVRKPRPGPTPSPSTPSSSNNLQPPPPSVSIVPPSPSTSFDLRQRP